MGIVLSWWDVAGWVGKTSCKHHLLTTYDEYNFSYSYPLTTHHIHTYTRPTKADMMRNLYNFTSVSSLFFTRDYRTTKGYVFKCLSFLGCLCCRIYPSLITCISKPLLCLKCSDCNCMEMFISLYWNQYY